MRKGLVQKYRQEFIRNPKRGKSKAISDLLLILFNFLKTERKYRKILQPLFKLDQFIDIFRPLL
jgi:hypothetical protein